MMMMMMMIITMMIIYTPYKKNVRVRRTSVRLSVVVVVVVGAFLRRCQSRAGFPGPPKGNFYRE